MRPEGVIAEVEADLAWAEEASDRPARRFTDFRWSTVDSWSWRLRVIGKVELTCGAANPCFVVTRSSPTPGTPAKWAHQLLRTGSVSEV